MITQFSYDMWPSPPRSAPKGDEEAQWKSFANEVRRATGLHPRSIPSIEAPDSGDAVITLHLGRETLYLVAYEMNDPDGAHHRGIERALSLSAQGVPQKYPAPYRKVGFVGTRPPELGCQNTSTGAINPQRLIDWRNGDLPNASFARGL